MEGLLIDIKTRCDSVHGVDSFRPEIESFLDSVFLTDACMIYAPSQIALAAIIHAASRQKQNLDRWSVLSDVTFANDDGIVQLCDRAFVWRAGRVGHPPHHHLCQEHQGHG